jgi:hypothetical protein
LKHSIQKRAGTRISAKAPQAIAPPIGGQGNALAQRSTESRNRANTIRNSVKVEHYLMEVEKAHGFAKSWALRERLEQGHVTLNELMHR